MQYKLSVVSRNKSISRLLLSPYTVRSVPVKTVHAHFPAFRQRNAFSRLLPVTDTLLVFYCHTMIRFSSQKFRGYRVAAMVFVAEENAWVAVILMFENNGRQSVREYNVEQE